ncbi:MAG: hypothetical protein Tsb0032_32540 [Kiloniellaceae bacterium]
MGGEKAAEGPTFEPPKLLRGVRLGFLAAFEFRPEPYMAFTEGSCGRFIWRAEEAARATELANFAVAEEFLLGKQLFFGRERPIPSFPPRRGVSEARIRLAFKQRHKSIVADCEAVVSLFEEQGVLTALLHAEIDEISVDDLVFLKELKWYQGAEHPLIEVGPEATPARTMHEAICQVLRCFGADPVRDNHWPIFDFIELNRDGPSVGNGPNEGNRLSVAEHWALLTGDEGFRLIDSDDEKYAKFLKSEEHLFRGRSYFLYQFFPTSCLAFTEQNADAIRGRWQAFYRENVQEIPVLDAYIGLSTRVVCLRDGIPLLVEVCLLRYIELTRIDRALSKFSEQRRLRSLATLGQTLARLGGVTAVERSAAALHRLDLYQESALWIIGGAYTSSLYQYERLRNRIERTIQLYQSTSSDIRFFYLGVFSLSVAILAILTSG